jgi:anti-sigma B factor antagonist
MAATHTPFRATERAVGPTAVVSLHGELDIQHHARVTGAFNRALDRHPAALAADLRGLTFMDSTGVHVLLRIEATCRRQGVRFFIVRGPSSVDRVLSVLGLDRRFEIVSSPEQLPGDNVTLAAAV